MIVGIAIFQLYIDWFRFRKDHILYAHSGYTTSKLKAIPEAKIPLPATTTAEEEFDNAGPELGNTSGFHLNAFDHPALWKKQPSIWIASDPLGVGKFEMERIDAAGVEASTEFAHMDEKGKTTVERGPPDEAWYGGHSSH